MNFIKFFLLFLGLNSLIFGQNKLANKIESRDKERKTDGISAINDKIEFKNEKGNPIITITDEGFNAGSITIPQSSPSTTSNKLYNQDGVLKFNGSVIGSDGGADSINQLVDARYTGLSLFLGEEAGINDDGTDNYNVGVGVNALKANTSGSLNTAYGSSSLISNISGSENVVVGYGALNANQNGNRNTAIGSHAGSNGLGFEDRYGNIFLGYRAGYNSFGNNKLYINNDQSNSPLIWGDFETDDIKINGSIEITDDTQIGVSGVPISEVKLLTGSLSTTLFVTEIPYPTGYNQSNTFLVSCKVGPPSGTGTIWENVGKYGSGDDRSLSVSFSETQILLYRTDSSTSARDYKMVLMRID